MLKAVEVLVNSSKNTIRGNHRVEVDINADHYFYHWTEICRSYHDKKEFWVDNGGFGTSSTTRAINDYRRHFLSLGYTEISKEK